MLNLTTMSTLDREKWVKAQQVDLNFDWFSRKQSDQDKLTAVADTMYELVRDQVVTTNPLPAIFETQTGAAGKVIKAKRHYGGKVYERSYGEYKKASHFKAEFYTMTTTAKALHIEVPVEELKAGIVTIPELSEQAAQAILYHKVSTVWNTLKSAISTSDTNCTIVGSTITQTGIDYALRTFRDLYEVAGIFGRFGFLSNLVSYSGYDGGTGFPETVKQELHNRGMIGQYMGVPILTMQRFQDEMYNTDAIDATNAFIVARKKDFNRYVEVTPLTSASEVRLSDGTWHMYFDFEDGYAIWEPKYIWRLAASA